MIFYLQRRTAISTPSECEVSGMVVHLHPARLDFDFRHVRGQRPADPNLEAMTGWRDLRVRVSEALYHPSESRLRVFNSIEGIIKVDPHQAILLEEGECESRERPRRQRGSCTIEFTPVDRVRGGGATATDPVRNLGTALHPPDSPAGKLREIVRYDWVHCSLQSCSSSPPTDYWVSTLVL